MHKVLVLGAGKIGTTISHILANSKKYHIYLADIQIAEDHPLISHKKVDCEILDVCNKNGLALFLQNNPCDAIISCLPYFINISVAKIAAENDLHYFDLTEDMHTSDTISEIAKNKNRAFVPQCGVAPGFINIVANELMQQFDTLNTVKLRCGALPINTSNTLGYALTWSTDGLINEYGNPCRVIENGEETLVSPLDGLEEIHIDGLTYEAFSTSGGIGTLDQHYRGRVNTLNYKSIRYPGHCQKMRFLMRDLKLNEDRNILKTILEKVIPATLQDVVIIYVSVSGEKNNKYLTESYVRKFYPNKIENQKYAAIQMITATSACSVIDTVLNNPKQYHGRIFQEHFSLQTITQNRFGSYLNNGNQIEII